MATQKIHLKSSDIINAESVKEHIRSLLADACKMVRDRARKHIKGENGKRHYITGRLYHSIRYATEARQTKSGYTVTGKVFINEAETPAEKTKEVRSYSYFIVHGTKDWHRTISEAQSGRKKALKWFDKRKNRKFRALWHRKGVEADDFLHDALEDCRDDIIKMFENGVRMIEVEF